MNFATLLQAFLDLVGTSRFGGTIQGMSSRHCHSQLCARNGLHSNGKSTANVQMKEYHCSGSGKVSMN